LAQRNGKNGCGLKGFVLILENERPISNNKFYEGMHWAERKAEADRVHARVQAACASWKAKMGRPLPRFEHGARVIITAYFEKRPLDSSNIAGKLYEDGACAGGHLAKRRLAARHRVSACAVGLIESAHELRSSSSRTRVLDSIREWRYDNILKDYSGIKRSVACRIMWH
jgi:hypothetical protein